MLQRLFRLDSSFADPEKHTTLERIFWAIPPVLVAWLLTFGPFIWLLAFLSDRLP
jgi:hypothetical protein